MPLLEQVLKMYPKDVKLVFKNLPLTRIHKYAMNAALSAMAAHEQGKFWEFHDLLFADYNKLSDQKINEIAQKVGLDMAQFEKDKESQKIRQQVNNDMREAATVGVTGTPTIFINGRRLKNRSLKGFQDAINSELQKVKK